MSRFALAVFALAIGQSAFLGAMVWERVSLLRSPIVVTLETAPIDPRDLFRGHYVILNFAISQLALGDLDGDDEFERGKPVYVELAPEGKLWKPVAAWREFREAGPGNAIMRGRVTNIMQDVFAGDAMDGEEGRRPPCPDCGSAFVTYGIESYFVPEGEGRELEDSRNAGRITIDVALGRDGTPAIKQLRLDGEPIYEEPLF
ncbi:GDYXXLXY domain-containing protein [Parvibaculum sp.]|uniref:GDYXXLXY domain-containing protein n=1 Tax=Parvibaculum sp. TaxID=2024848 RepID=UPI00391CC193